MRSVAPTLSDAERGSAVRRVLLWTLLLNLLVAAAKVAYGTLTHTLSIRADGYHSTTDGINNLIGLVGIWLGSRPPDSGHPYGHRKFEVVAAGLVGLALLGMAFDVAMGLVDRLKGTAQLPVIDAGSFIVLLVTLAVNIGVARYERREGQRLDSSFLLSDAAHTRSDILTTSGVLASVLCVRFGFVAADVIAAIAVALFICWAGISVLRANLSYLLDAAQVDEARVRDAVLVIPGVASTHKIRSRGTPGAIHVDLHIQIAPHLDVEQAHTVTHWVIDAIKREVAGVIDVVVHTEPARRGEPYRALPWEERAPSEESGR